MGPCDQLARTNLLEFWRVESMRERLAEGRRLVSGIASHLNCTITTFPYGTALFSFLCLFYTEILLVHQVYTVEQDVNSCIVSVSLVGCWCDDIRIFWHYRLMPATCPKPLSSIADSVSIDGGHWATWGPYMLRACSWWAWKYSSKHYDTCGRQMYAQTANNIHIQNLEVQPPFSKRWLMF